MNILIQLLYPVISLATPSTASADEAHLKNQGVIPLKLKTNAYTFDEGESVSSVAKKYHLTLEQLRELNQFRTFAHGFDHLKPGDGLDVPVTPLPEVRWEQVPSTQNVQARQEQKIAGYASQAGIVLSSDSGSDAAGSMARTMATGEAGSALQNGWLTVSVQQTSSADSRKAS